MKDFERGIRVSWWNWWNRGTDGTEGSSRKESDQEREIRRDNHMECGLQFYGLKTSGLRQWTLMLCVFRMDVCLLSRHAVLVIFQMDVSLLPRHAVLVMFRMDVNSSPKTRGLGQWTRMLWTFRMDTLPNGHSSECVFRTGMFRVGVVCFVWLYEDWSERLRARPIATPFNDVHFIINIAITLSIMEISEIWVHIWALLIILYIKEYTGSDKG